MVNTTNTYAGAPVLYTFTVCNNSDDPQDVELTDTGLSNFTATSSTPTWVGFPAAPLTVNVPAHGCTTVEVAGHFTAIGSYTNCVEAVVPDEDPLQDCADEVTVHQNCPLAVSGTGDCTSGPVNLCMSVHSLITNIGVIEFDWIYPAFLEPPTQAALLGSLSPPLWGSWSFTNASTISAPTTPPTPYDVYDGVAYEMVHVELVFDSPFSTLGQPRMFCMQFAYDAPVPSGMNTFRTLVLGTNGHHRTDLYEYGTNAEIHPGAGFLTQGANVILTGCPGVTGDELIAGFTVQAPHCGGQVHVQATNDPAGAIHMWTWGDGRTTPINGASQYTYDYFEPIGMNTEWPVVPPIPGAAPGTYTITHTVIVDGVAHSSTQEVTIYQCCEAATIVPDGTLASDGMDGFGPGTVAMQGAYIVDVYVPVTNAQVYMEPGSEIIVKNGGKLYISNSSFTSCSGVMWRGITVESGGTLYISNSYMDDAEGLVTALDGAVVTLKDNQFHNNRVSVHVPAGPGPFQHSIVLEVTGNIFYSAGAMPTPYPGQATAVGTTGFAAFDIQRVPLGLTNGWNLFHHLSNGIVADRCDITLRDCSFQDIQPDAAYTLTGNGAAIHARASKGWHTLDQEGSFVNGQLPFRACRWAVYTERMNVFSSANRMEQVGTAYHVEKSMARRVRLIDNVLDTKRNAIELLFNDGALELLVEDNEITFANTAPPGEPTRGYTAIRVEENNGDNPSSAIRNNTITYRSGVSTAHTGIRLRAATDYLVAGNVLHMTDNATNYAGIQLLGCSFTEVSCNMVNGASDEYPQKGQAAIRNVKGKAPYISCNTVNKTTNGLLFSGESYGADVRGNHIHKHKWGLHLDGTAIIDVQELKGNLWYEPAQAIEALYEVNDQQSALSQFRVDPITIGSGVTWPPNWSPNDWFQYLPGTTYDCADDQKANYCDQFGGEKCEKCEHGLDKRIAADSLTNDPYTEQTKWTLKGDLYAKLDEAPELRDSLPDMEAFYTALQYDVIGQLKAVEDGRGALADVDSTVAAVLKANQEQISTLLELAKATMAQLEDTTLTNTQRQAIAATLAGYQQNIRSLAGYNTTVAQLARDTKVLTAEGIRTANAALGATELTETNQKEVNEVYLATIGKEVDGFTPQQAATLYAIANQCPMVGGNAVFRARALYTLIDDAQDYDDELLCLQQGIIVKSLRKPAASALSVVPNPANDEATLVLTETLDEPGVFVVFDALGAEVVRYTVPAGSLRHTVNTAALAPALYHFQVRGPSGLLGVGKLTIVR